MDYGAMTWCGTGLESDSPGWRTWISSQEAVPGGSPAHCHCCSLGIECLELGLGPGLHGTLHLCVHTGWGRVQVLPSGPIPWRTGLETPLAGASMLHPVV